MGRNSTGAITEGAALRIELSYLIKKGFIKKDCLKSGTLSWTNGSNIRFQSNYYAPEGNYLRLIYTNTDRNGEKTDHDYKIQLTTVPSNLGKGEVLYFICPVTHKRCRVLYCCYGSPIWKSRFAYHNRIYYQSQVSSKRSYWNDMYWEFEKKIKNLESNRRKQYTYKGKPTKFAVRLQKLQALQDCYDQMRWSASAFPLSLRRSIFKV